MTVTDFVRVFPDMVQVQAVKREKRSVRAVENVNFVGEFQVVLLLESSVDVRFENRALGRDAKRLDKARIVELVQDFFADGFKSRKVGIQKDDAKTAAIGQIPQNVDEPEVREHREDTDAPGAFNSLARAAPAEEVVLVGVHLDVQERLARPVRPQKFLVKACPEEPCRVDNVLEFLLVEN